jgi:hypothetical protein
MTPAERAARERKQKIFVVVGGVLLLGLLAIQLPKLLVGSGSESPTAAPAQQSALPGDPAGATPRRVAAVALVDTDRRLGATPGKLTSLSVFAAKDPFVQQVETDSSFGETTADTAGNVKGVEDKAKTPPKGFTVGSPAAALTLISVNGARQALEPGAVFPTSDPVFVLVAEQAASKTAVIGVAGGAYAGGAKTTKLKVGKPLTLVNTTTGARYRIVLVAVGSGESAEPAKPKP